MAGKAGSVNNHRLTVALTFDFDAESFWLYQAQSASTSDSVPAISPSAVSRGTYGAREGVPRILKLLSKYSRKKINPQMRVFSQGSRSSSERGRAPGASRPPA